jgi:hypothetical protein
MVCGLNSRDQSRDSSYNMAEAHAIADEMIVYWRNRGITARDAWEALHHARRTNVSWAMVHGDMVRWLLSRGAIERLAA